MLIDGQGLNLHFHNAIVRADIENLPTKLMRQMRDGLQMLVLMPQSLTGRQSIRVICLRLAKHLASTLYHAWLLLIACILKLLQTALSILLRVFRIH